MKTYEELLSDIEDDIELMGAIPYRLFHGENNVIAVTITFHPIPAISPQL